jgi:titin
MPFIGGRSSATRGFFGIGGTPSESTSLSSLEGNQQLAISFTDPTFSGGGDIVNYQYSLSTDGTTFSAFTSLDPADTTSPITIGGLTNGQQYYVKIRAVNAISAGLESAVLSTNTTPFTISGAPTITSVTSPSSGSVTVAYSAPSSNGGRSITDYVVEYSSNSGSSWTAFTDGTSTATSITVTGLTNGTSYIFRVYAVTVAGNGTVSANSSAIVPFTVPNVPTSFTTTAGSSSLILAFTTPASNGGSQITGYEYSTDGGTTYVLVSGDLSTSTAVTRTVAGLTPGTTFQTRVRVVNARGAGTAASSSGTPYTVPNAPTSFTTTAGSSELILAFTTPASNGGSQITGYEYSTNGGTTYVLVSGNLSTSTAVTRTVTGLTAGTTFQTRVRVVNAAGAGAAASSSGTPYTVPNAPTGFTATAGSSSLVLDFTTPASNGGSQITGYEYITHNDGNRFISGAIYVDVYGLTLYTTGTAHGYSTGEVVTVTGVTPSSFDRTAEVVAFSATQFYFTLFNGSTSGAYSSGGTSFGSFTAVNGNLSTSTAVTKTVTGLIPSNTYSTRVRVVNAAGAGATASASGTPYTIPDAPATPTSSSGDQFYEVTWVAPATGGSAITGYDVELLDIAAGTTTLFNAGSTIRTKKFTGLTIGKEYKARVRAKNAAGDGTYSDYATTRTPSFAVTAPTLSVAAGYPSTTNSGTWGKRPVQVSFDPTDCLNFSKASIHFKVTGTYNPTEVVETTSNVAAGTIFYTFVNAFGDTQNIGTSVAVECFMRVHNTAGQYVQSATTTFTTSASVNHYTYTENNTFATDVQTVTSTTMGKKFFNWSGTSNQNVTLVALYTNIPVTNYNTVSVERNPVVRIHGNTTASVRGSIALYDLAPLRAVTGGGYGETAIYAGEYWNPGGDDNSSYAFGNDNQKISVEGYGVPASTYNTNRIINVKAIVVYTQRTANSI